MSSVSLLGKRVKRLRQAKGMSQNILARQVGVTGNTIARLDAVA